MLMYPAGGGCQFPRSANVHFGGSNSHISRVNEGEGINGAGGIIVRACVERANDIQGCDDVRVLVCDHAGGGGATMQPGVSQQ